MVRPSLKLSANVKFSFSKLRMLLAVISAAATCSVLPAILSLSLARISSRLFAVS